MLSLQEEMAVEAHSKADNWGTYIHGVQFEPYGGDIDYQKEHFRPPQAVGPGYADIVLMAESALLIIDGTEEAEVKERLVYPPKARASAPAGAKPASPSPEHAILLKKVIRKIKDRHHHRAKALVAEMKNAMTDILLAQKFEPFGSMEAQERDGGAFCPGFLDAQCAIVVAHESLL